MKTYRKPVIKTIDLQGESIMDWSANDEVGDSGPKLNFSKGQGGLIIDDDEEE